MLEVMVMEAVVMVVEVVELVVMVVMAAELVAMLRPPGGSGKEVGSSIPSSTSFPSSLITATIYCVSP